METAGNSCCGGKDGLRKRNWHDQKTVRQLAVRLNRIEGQVRGIKRMIEEDVYCGDVLNQISSVRSALDGVARLLLEKHMKHCIRDQLLEGSEEVFDEALKTIFKLIR
ncbi:MAG TPA: metal-sensitive transcriptional regulator [Bacillota bacterium]|jgi:DNA-binding FrmR family transcriptional regulator|nr:metal-sensitive transcriptional regulator [Bacillota bacterium]HOL15534.1 metal-sensitive transcriptional regulator [Bacillota bacterium]